MLHVEVMVNDCIMQFSREISDFYLISDKINIAQATPQLSILIS